MSSGLAITCSYTSITENTAAPSQYRRPAPDSNPDNMINTTASKCENADRISDCLIPRLTGIESNLLVKSNSESCNEYIISNPATQHNTARLYNTGTMSNLPVTEMYAPTGARLSARPRMKWLMEVNRFVRL